MTVQPGDPLTADLWNQQHQRVESLDTRFSVLEARAIQAELRLSQVETRLMQLEAAGQDQHAAIVELQRVVADLSQRIPQDPSPNPAPAWKVGVHYSVGDRVSFAGRVYRNIQAHTSQQDWEPARTPALWSLVG